MSITAPSPAQIPSRGTSTKVPREYVHKVVGSEVLLTAWRPNGSDVYSVGARWPHQHSFYSPSHGLHDPLLVAESVRQTVPLLCHTAFDVPMGHRQAWTHFRYTINPAAMIATKDPAPVGMRVSCADVVRRGSRLASMNMQVDLMRQGIRLGTARTSFVNQPPAVYQRLRRQYADVSVAAARAIPLASPMNPHEVGRERFEDVVLSPTDSPNRMQLRVDLAHPVLFDHPLDHVPGMLLLEATRQAAHALAHPRPVIVMAMDAVFSRYAEFDAPCWIHADPLPSDSAGRMRVLISALQNGTCIYSSVATLEHRPPTH
ncbi:ScbA/BarX family gamma-butyrolactone biosynthesis protein [Streptomyces sp. NBC_00344]|uniref:ScbA/BarX family gamma-butyrolactone biosynthesis protein n=1 Tax=Streptomyces sp. NBC_00344 TaxID=2975720 RepID=UPI002E23A67F